MYGANTPLSESTNPTQASGNPSFNTNISTPLIMNCIYNKNSIMIIIKPTIAENMFINAKEDIAVVNEYCSCKFNAVIT